MPVGQLTIELSASLAKFQEDLGKASSLAEQHSRRIENSFTQAFDRVRAAATAVAAVFGVAFGVAEIANWSKNVVSAAEDLQHLSEVTGSSVENLSQLSNIAKVSGAGFDTFRSAIEKLAAGMTGSDDASTKTAKALQYMGVTARDPAQALTELALKLDRFADGAGKAALARDAFGRGGPEFLSTLKAIADNQGIVATTTEEQAKKAKELSEQMRLLAVNSHAAADALLNDVVPALGEIAKRFAEATKAGGSFLGGLKLFVDAPPFEKTADGIERVTKEIERYQAILAESHPIKDLFGIETTDVNTKANLERAQKTLEFLKQQQALENYNGDHRNADRQIPKPPLPYAGSKSGTGPIDDPTKKILEGYIADLNASIEQEKSLLATRNEVLGRYYSENYLSIKDYFGKITELRADNLADTLAAYKKELAGIDAYVNAKDAKGVSAHSEKDKQDELNKGIEIRKKIALAEIEFGKQSVITALDTSKATKDYENQVSELNASLLELTGNTAAAFAIREKLSTQQQRDKLTAAGDTNALGTLDQSTKLRQLLADARQEATKYAQALTVVDQAQQQINIDVETGASTTLEGLAKTSALYKQQLPLLEQIAEKNLAIAQAAGDPALILSAQAYILKLKELAATGDLVAREFNTVFHDSFANALVDAVTGTKTLKAAFNDMVNSIVAGISRIVANNLADALFGAKGQGGSLSGIGDLLSKLFGGASKDLAGTAALSGAGSVLTASGTTMLVAANAHVAAAAALTAAAAAMGLSSAASAGGGIFNALSSFQGPAFGTAANGSSFTSGGPYLVGERGPEVVVPQRGSQVIPNHRIGGNVTIVQYIGQVKDTATARQAAKMAGDHVSSTLRRR